MRRHRHAKADDGDAGSGFHGHPAVQGIGGEGVIMPVAVRWLDHLTTTQGEANMRRLAGADICLRPAGFSPSGVSYAAE